MEYKPIDIQTQFKEVKLHDEYERLSKPIFIAKNPSELPPEVRMEFLKCCCIAIDPTMSLSIIPSVLLL